MNKIRYYQCAMRSDMIGTWAYEVLKVFKMFYLQWIAQKFSSPFNKYIFFKFDIYFAH